MRYLLDTHTFIWLASEPDKLSSTVTVVCQNRANDLFLSLATLWETQLKIQLGKLTLPKPLEVIVKDQQNINQVELLPIDLQHILALTIFHFIIEILLTVCLSLRHSLRICLYFLMTQYSQNIQCRSFGRKFSC